MKRRNTREERVWRAKVIRRDKCCIICGTKKHREAHHLDDYSYHPTSRYLISNGVTLCRNCHTTYHCDFNKSFRTKTTKKNFLEFVKVVNYIRKISDIRNQISLKEILSRK